MTTVLREEGIAFRIYLNDHAPPHVHAIKEDGFAKIEIGNADVPPRVLKIGKHMRNQDLLKAVRVVERGWRVFLAAWRSVHGEEAAD